MVVTRVPDKSAAPAAEPEQLPHDRATGVAAVFEIHYAHLVRLAWALVGDPTEAEDVVMDAFAGLDRRWSHVRRTEDAFFYLRTSVVNGSRSRLRRLRVSRAKSHHLADLDGAPAEQVAMLHLEHQAVVIALRRLPRRQREVLVLRYYEEATEAEIAETLGISAGSVKTHASRGLHAVADLLEGSA